MFRTLRQRLSTGPLNRMILQLSGSRDNRRYGIIAHHEMNGDPLLRKRLLAHLDNEMIGAVETLMGSNDG